MKTLKLILVASFCLLAFASCNKDDDENNVGGGPVSCSAAWATELQNEVTAISNAAFAYASDPSTANCNSLKAAYQDYINALKPYGNCAGLNGQNRADYQQALQDAEDNLDTAC